MHLLSARLDALDWSVIAIYLLAVGAVGVLVSRGQRSTDDYFRGGRSLPWWAATLSIIATETSAVTFIGLPAAGYAGDWSVLQLVLGFVLGRVFLALVFVRVFYRANHVTVYGFLGDRFGPPVRITAASLFVVGRIVASGVRLFAGCLALTVAASVSVEWTIVALGVFGTAFTLIGGIRAVVWTDVILGITLVVGGLVAIAAILNELPHGLSTVVTEPMLGEKLRVLRFGGWNDASSLVVGVIGGFVLTLATHGTDQDIAQRMLTCKDSRSGSLSVLGSALLIVPLFALFLGIGTLLFIYFKHGSPGWAPPEDTDELFPLFIVRTLPHGLAGLVFAGLLAAALSSFTSALNALASTTIGDFYRPLVESRGRAADEAHLVRVARIVTAIWGALLIVVALGFVGSRDNIFSIALKVLNYFYGGLLGAFLLGMLTRARGSSRTLVPAMLLSVPVILALQLREWIDAPGTAPGALQSWLRSLDEETTASLGGAIPRVAWPWWILIGTTLTVALGAMGATRRRPEMPQASSPTAGVR